MRSDGHEVRNSNSLERYALRSCTLPNNSLPAKKIRGRKAALLKVHVLCLDLRLLPLRIGTIKALDRGVSTSSRSWRPKPPRSYARNFDRALRNIAIPIPDRVCEFGGSSVYDRGVDQAFKSSSHAKLGVWHHGACFCITMATSSSC